MVTFKFDDLGSGIGVTHIIDDDGTNVSVKEIDREPNTLADIKGDHEVKFNTRLEAPELEGEELASDTVYKPTDGLTI